MKTSLVSRRRWMAGVAALAAATPAVAQQAAPVPATPPAAAPAPSTDISLAAREQPIGAFLRDLFGRAGRPVVVSPNLTGTVNGVFRGGVTKIFADISKAFNLVSYNDGAALYVYAANEISVQTLDVGRDTAQRVRGQAARLSDQRNFVRVSGEGGLVASGTPRFIEQVTSLAKGGGGGGASGGGGGGGPAVADLRPPAPPPLEFRVFYLRYARAEDTVVNAGGQQTRVPGLATIIQNLVLDQRPGGSALGNAPQFGARLVRQSQPRLKGQGLDAVAPDGSQTPTGGFLPNNSYAPISSDVLGGVDGPSSSGALVAPVSQDVVRIEPSPYLNALIVRDVPERMAAYDALIRALDIEPQVVEIEATIIDIDIDKLRRLGINFRVGSGGFGGLFGNGTSSDNALAPSFGADRRTATDAITSSALGGTISTIIGSGREFIGRVTALENKGAARIVQRPQIVTLANVEAVFDRTRTFYVRVAGREEVDLFNVTAGTVLRVNPHVFRDHDQTRIRMLVNIEDGSISPTSAVENIPIVERSSVATQAMVVDGESLLLGGMTADADNDSLYKVPLLGDIPLLGELFKFREKSRAHTERLFLITPRIVSLAARVGPTTVTATPTVETIRPVSGGPALAPGATVAAPAPAPTTTR